MVTANACCRDVSAMYSIVIKLDSLDCCDNHAYTFPQSGGRLSHYAHRSADHLEKLTFTETRGTNAVDDWTQDRSEKRGMRDAGGTWGVSR